jgi:hypothetical protein
MKTRPSKGSDPVQLPKSQFSVGLPGPQFKELTKLAQREGRSRASYAGDVLAKHLADLKAKA